MFLRRHAGVDERERDVFERRGARQKIEALKHEPQLTVADLRQIVAGELRDVLSVGESRHPSMFIIVDLPEPDGPITATNSPRSMENETLSSARSSTPPVL
jgi:hypothetical protein